MSAKVAGYAALVEREARRTVADAAKYWRPLSAEWIAASASYMGRADWVPGYSVWRHGGSYVSGVRYPSGAIGCIASARHTISGRFEVACFDLGKFKTRREAADAERQFAVDVSARVLQLLA